jgi:2-methylfumaryl-CoA isomerase
MPTDETSANEPVLAGMRVVELSAYVAAPLCGATLAELGADVVRIDPPGGGVDYHRWPLHNGRSLYWMGLNQGKRSVCIDTRTARGRELVIDLIAAAGTCITNLPLGEWMSYDVLRNRREDVVLLTIVGNPDGSVAVDYTVNAAIGFPWITGPEDFDGPVNHVLPAWDVITAHNAVSAILAAELRRSRTGRGANIELSLMNVALATASHLGLLAEAQLVQEPRARYGNFVYGTFGRDFRTGDGQYIMVVTLTPRQWRSLVAATDTADEIASLERDSRRDFLTEGDRFECRHDLAAVFERWIASRPLEQVREAFDRSGVLWGPYQTFKELVRDDPRAREGNPLMHRMPRSRIGDVFAAASPIADVGTTPMQPTPEMGVDTREVLSSWIQLPAAELDALERQKVLATS